MQQHRWAQSRLRSIGHEFAGSSQHSKRRHCGITRLGPNFPPSFLPTPHVLPRLILENPINQVALPSSTLIRATSVPKPSNQLLGSFKSHNGVFKRFFMRPPDFAFANGTCFAPGPTHRERIEVSSPLYSIFTNSSTAYSSLQGQSPCFREGSDLAYLPVIHTERSLPAPDYQPVLPSQHAPHLRAAVY